MIAYFDTSAVVPLIVDEPGSERAGRLWDQADRVASVRLVYPEARAAVAQAHRDRRLSGAALRTAIRGLDGLVQQFDIVELTEELAYRAGQLTESQALRGYDAVHLAAAEQLHDDDFVLVAGDSALLRAGETLGFAIATTG